MSKVLIADALSARAAAIFAERGIEAQVMTGLSPEDLKRIIGQFDGLAVRSSTKVTKALLEHATNLKVIGRAGIGVDNIDVAAATQRGIVVMNTPYGNSITTAEHAIALMFALARQLPAADRSTQEGKWEKSRFMGVELAGKTLGVVGCGNIGSIVADRAIGLHMKVVAYDPFLSPERAVTLGVEKLELDALFARADFVTLHTPLTDATRNIIDAAAIAKMKKGVRIINCARGGLIVEADLKAALDSGQVAGAALDVFIAEPATDNPLFGHENLVATPHLGAATNEAQENVALQIAEQMADFLTTGAVANAINMPALSAEEATRLKPYMHLAAQLGSFAGQMSERGIETVTLEYEGAVAELNVKPLTAIALTALLGPRAQHPGQRDDARRADGLPDLDPSRRHRRRARSHRRRHAVRRRQAASGRDRGHRHGSGARRLDAVHPQPGQARLHRQSRPHPQRERRQHRDFPSRPHRAREGRHRPHPGRPAAHRPGDRPGLRDPERDQDEGAQVLRRHQGATRND